MSFADEIQARMYALMLAVIRLCRTLPPTAEAREWAERADEAVHGPNGAPN
jgi:hypothetical protein